MVDVAMAMRRLTSLNLLLFLAMVLPRYVKLSVVVTGCVPMSVDGVVWYPRAEGLNIGLGPVDSQPQFFEIVHKTSTEHLSACRVDM